jgi:hypothetical protein
MAITRGSIGKQVSRPPQKKGGGLLSTKSRLTARIQEVSVKNLTVVPKRKKPEEDNVIIKKRKVLLV